MHEKNGTEKQTKSPTESYCLKNYKMKLFYVMVFDMPLPVKSVRYIQNLPV